MVTLHSMQMPIPQRGPRDSPETEWRNEDTPARAMPAATTVPAGTWIDLPLTEM